MPKRLKTVLIAFGGVLAAIAAAFAAFWIWMHTCFLEVTPRDMTVCYDENEREESERLISEGYVISYPHFHNMTSINYDNDGRVYDVFNRKCSEYANQIAKSYKNYACLDYTVEVKNNDTLTVMFTGTGYFYDDREPVSLDKTFVFDIKDISPEHLPTLIGE